MNERRALTLLAIALVLVEAMMLTGLSLLHAGSDVVVFAYIVLMAGGAYLVSAIIMRYH